MNDDEWILLLAWEEYSDIAKLSQPSIIFVKFSMTYQAVKNKINSKWDSGKFSRYIEFILTVILFVERMRSMDDGYRTAHWAVAGGKIIE